MSHDGRVTILRSSLVPRVIGGLLIGTGVSYFLNSLTAIVSPALHARLLPWILLSFFVGELSLACWLMIEGITTGDRPVS